jgi:acyl-CoA thioester hydrolase
VKITDNKPDAAVFRWPLRVYYEDTDAAGVVYYANYLKFLERARTEWLRAAGFEQTALRDELGVVFVVRSLAVDYAVAAQFNDALEVTVAVRAMHGSVIELVQNVCRNGAALVTASVKIACVNTPSFKPVRIPKSIVENLLRGAHERHA